MHFMKMLCHFILVLLAANVSGLDEVVVVRAVRGREARLPCGQGKIFLDGPDSYVLWLKNNREFRYRFPNPESVKKPDTSHYSLDTSCELGFCDEDTSLVIKTMTDRDKGLYRCRVHYQGSPSVDYLINVKLVEPTGIPRLYTGDGELLNKGFMGPLSLDSDLTLVCEVANKDQKTDVYWRRNGALIEPQERTFTSHPGNLLRVNIRLHNLSRGDIDAHYECLVQNADVTEPLVASVFIRMYLPPISVEIRMNNNYDFEAGQPRVVDCIVVGCIPPPAIDWHLGSVRVRASVHKELHDGNYTVSSLSLAPSLQDHHKELVCRARNTFMLNKLFQDKVTLNVGFRPTCQVGREEKIGGVIRETQTVKCIVDASPEPVQFSWTFADSKTLHTTFTKVAGYPNRYTSTLTWQFQNKDIGMLHCRATNAFGEQKKPCIYKISLGGPPELPECNVRRIYPNSLKVQCEKGWDGGRPQTIHLDIVNEDGTRIKNVSNSAGNFYLPNIMNQVNLTAVLYATNARGKSGKRITYLHSLPMNSEVGINSIQSHWTPYIEAFTGVVALTIAATIIILGARVLLTRSDESDEISVDVVPLPDGTFRREPDILRDERLHGNTNVSVNQLPACQNQYSSSPLPTCRLLGSHGPLSPPEACPSSQQTYYV